MNKFEFAIQKEVVRCLRSSVIMAYGFHVDAGGNKTVGEAAQSKRLGVLAGVPDLVIPLPEGKTLWLELKTMKGRLSQRQKDYHAMLEEYGHEVRTAYGLQDALAILDEVEQRFK